MAFGLGHLQHSREHLHLICGPGSSCQCDAEPLEISRRPSINSKTTDPALHRPSIFVPPAHWPMTTLMTKRRQRVDRSMAPARHFGTHLRLGTCNKEIIGKKTNREGPDDAPSRWLCVSRRCGTANCRRKMLMTVDLERSIGLPCAAGFVWNQRVGPRVHVCIDVRVYII